MSYATYDELGNQAELARDERVVMIKSAEHKTNLINTVPLVLVDVYADWCAPCKNIEEEYKNIAQKYTLPNQCTVARENVDMRLSPDVTGIPTFLLFNKGKLVEQGVGAFALKGMEEKLKAYYQTLSPSFQQIDPVNVDRMSPQVSKVIRQYKHQAPVVESSYNPLVSGSHVGYATYNAPVPRR